VTTDQWRSGWDFLIFGYNGATSLKFSTFLRTPMSLLPEVTLNSVYIQGTAYSVSTGPSYDMEILGVDETNCPSLEGDQSTLSTIQDSPPLLWTCANWTMDATYNTPSLTGLLRTYLDRGDYDPSAGYYWGLVFKWPGVSMHGAGRPRIMVSSGHADAATKAMKLVIEYTMPEGNVQVEETLAICQTFTKDMAIMQEVSETVAIAQKVEKTVGIAQETNATLGICQAIRGTLVR
ncbi:hypothetical protein LCGC14_2329290, partial [marine sediment metagenome]